jgi:two-component system phosphate regulon sensor histidine kinase PhoR
MRKRLPAILIFLMSISLIGIIAVQLYWISTGIRDKEQQFSFIVKQALASTAFEVQNIEIDKYFNAFSTIQDSLSGSSNLAVLKLQMLKQRNAEIDESIRYSTSPLSDNYKLDPSFLDTDLDSVTFAALLRKKVIVEEIIIDSTDAGRKSEEMVNKLSSIDAYERRQIGEWVNAYSAATPISSRVSTSQVQQILQRELEKRDIKEYFEFAVYQDGYQTRVHKGEFDLYKGSVWQYPLFRNESAESPYRIYVNIPGKTKFILSSLSGIILLSLIFTVIIVIAYASSILQIFNQRKISQIKTDFINNMTHEFKTPIATINLALDSLKHPKINSNPEKVTFYHGLIREENKRMHTQVENVLRISQLDRDDLNIEKTRHDMQAIIEESISHVQLILQNRYGIIQFHPGALHNDVLLNESHMTNVMVNLLENAIKYTDDAKSPVIDVFTENVKNKIIIKIRDNGIGINKTAHRKVFQKFFREHTGDVHNVKGHGLGLAYVKRIVEDHLGDITVQSNKGEGSTFSIYLPTLT